MARNDSLQNDLASLSTPESPEWKVCRLPLPPPPAQPEWGQVPLYRGQDCRPRPASRPQACPPLPPAASEGRRAGSQRGNGRCPLPAQRGGLGRAPRPRGLLTGGTIPLYMEGTRAFPAGGGRALGRSAETWPGPSTRISSTALRASGQARRGPGDAGPDLGLRTRSWSLGQGWRSLMPSISCPIPGGLKNSRTLVFSQFWRPGVSGAGVSRAVPKAPKKDLSLASSSAW